MVCFRGLFIAVNFGYEWMGELLWGSCWRAMLEACSMSIFAIKADRFEC